ncbi:MAG: hypothetical protein AAB486_03030 [Patescibacteria group bacterium]
MENRVTAIVINPDGGVKNVLSIIDFLHQKGLRIGYVILLPNQPKFTLEDGKGCPVVLENDLREEVRNLPGVVTLENLPTGLGQEAVWKGY